MFHQAASSSPPPPDNIDTQVCFYIILLYIYLPQEGVTDALSVIYWFYTILYIIKFTITLYWLAKKKKKKQCLTIRYQQGRRQGKSLEGAKVPRESRGQRPLPGVQGEEPVGWGQGAKPSEVDASLVLKSW